MKAIKAFGQFWYDFIIGDDWKIAVAVLCALVATGITMSTGLLGDHLLALTGGLLVVAAFATSLVIDVRGSAPR